MGFQLLFALLVILQLGSNLVEAYNYDYEDGGFLFSSSNIIEIPDSCKGKLFCFDKGEHYPDKLIDKLVGNLRDMELEDPEELRISRRSCSENGVFESECKTSVSNNLIYYITDTKQRERVVVQSKAEGHFRQYYDLTWCSEEGPISNTPHFLHDMKCVTKTMDLDFFVLSENYDSDYTKMTVTRAAIPVCCRCERDTETFYRRFDKSRQNSMTNSNYITI